NGFGQGELSRAADLLNAGLTEMSGATSPRLQLELICARILLPGSGRSRDAVLSRVERMERRIGMSATGAAANLPPTQEPGPAQSSGQALGQAQASASGGASSESGAPEASAPAAAGRSGANPGANQSSAGNDDFDDIAAMAVAAESMLNEPAQPTRSTGPEESAPTTQEPDAAPAPEQPTSGPASAPGHGDQQSAPPRPNEPQRSAPEQSVSEA